jgi:hypothetical protein
MVSATQTCTVVHFTVQAYNIENFNSETVNIPLRRFCDKKKHEIGSYFAYIVHALFRFHASADVHLYNYNILYVVETEMACRIVKRMKHFKLEEDTPLPTPTPELEFLNNIWGLGTE